MQFKHLLMAMMACLLLAVAVEARSVAQLKAAVLAEQSSRLSASSSALPDAPVGAKVADLAKYAGAKKVVQVKPSGIAAQLPGDKENNEDAIKATEFDLRWAKSIKEKHIRTAAALVPTTDRTNERFIDMQAKNTRLPLIEPSLFNE